jgi:hypothetical protein
LITSAAVGVTRAREDLVVRVDPRHGMTPLVSSISPSGHLTGSRERAVPAGLSRQADVAWSAARITALLTGERGLRRECVHPLRAAEPGDRLHRS